MENYFGGMKYLYKLSHHKLKLLFYSEIHTRISAIKVFLISQNNIEINYVLLVFYIHFYLNNKSSLNILMKITFQVKFCYNC